jgi:hypothetical protein
MLYACLSNLGQKKRFKSIPTLLTNVFDGRKMIANEGLGTLINHHKDA